MAQVIDRSPLDTFPQLISVTHPDLEGSSEWIQDHPWARYFDKDIGRVFWENVRNAPLWWLSRKGYGSFFTYVLKDAKTLVVPPGSLSIHSKHTGEGVGTQIQLILEEVAKTLWWNLVVAIKKEDTCYEPLLRKNGYLKFPEIIEGHMYFIHESSPVLHTTPSIWEQIEIFQKSVHDLIPPENTPRTAYQIQVLR